MMSDLLLKQI